MPPKLKTALMLITVASLVGTVAIQQTSRPPAVRDVLPKAQSSAAFRAFKQRMQSTVAFVDPASGEFRTPLPGEHNALAGSRPAFEPTVVRLPDGGVAVGPGAGKVNYLVATEGADGSMSFSHTSRAGKSGARDAR